VSILESALYGILSGLTELLPISAQAVQILMLRLFGVSGREPVRDLLVHLAALAGLVVACRGFLGKLIRESRTAQMIHLSMQHMHEFRCLYYLRLVKTAAVPMLIGMVLSLLTRTWEMDLLFVVLFSVLNGILLFIPDRIPQGNKDARSMSSIEAVLIGIGGALSCLPGVSRVGGSMTLAAACGADKKHSVNWALLLSIPALCALVVLDIFAIIQVGFGIFTGWVFLGYIVSALCAFAGAYLSVTMVRAWVVRSGFSGLSYCAWGMAVFMFILYLIV